MSKVLVFNVPAHGHVNPTLAVVQELAARGEEIIYYLTDEFKQKIQSTGVAFRRYEPVVREPSQSFPFITHGGMNSVMEALYYGVPLVAIPQMPEQAFTAERVAQLGLGVAIEKTAVTASKLQSAVAQVAKDPQFRQKAQHIQNVVQSAGGYKQAVEAILKFKESAINPKS